MQQNLNSSFLINPSSSPSQKMPPQQNIDHHLNQQQIPIYHHQQHDFESSTPHDDFLEHMISTFQNPTNNNSNWDHLPTNGPDSPSSTKSAMAMMMLQNQMMMMSRGGGAENVDDSVVQSLVNGGFNGSGGQISNPNPNFHQNQTPNFGATSGAAVINGAPANGSGGVAPTQPRQRVRARRGQATDPHSIAERLRRERIAERMKSLQELVPNANKTDKASMLDEIIEYVKFLQLQVKVLSMSRLGGAGAVAPLVANLSSEGGSDCVQATNGAQTSSPNDNMTVTEHQVAKLMEQDMGSAMQYLQGKGLCLMPISLANAISSSTCHSRSHPTATTGEGSLSPTMSVLTVQSANGDNGAVSKPL